MQNTLINRALCQLLSTNRCTFPCPRGISSTRVSSQPLEECVYVRVEESNPLHPHHIIQDHPGWYDPACDEHLRMKMALPLLLSISSSCFSPLCRHLSEGFLPHPRLSTPPPSSDLSKASTRSQSQDPMTCKSVPLISLWRDAEWSGEVSCPLTSAPHPTRPSLSADCGLCLSLINEMYDNVISLIEWHSLMVLCDYD